MRIPHPVHLCRELSAGLTLRGLLLSAVVFPLAATGGQWDSQSLVSVIGRYNDNPTLLPEELNPTATSIAVGYYEAEFTYAEADREFSIAPRVQGNYYIDRDFEELDSIDYFLNLGAALNRERRSWSLTSSINQQSILSSEDTDPNDPDSGGDGNFLRADDTRTQLRAAPNLSWAVSPKDTLGLGASFTKVDYELDFTGRADYDTYTLNLSYQRALSPRQTLGVLASWLDTSSERLGLVVVCDGNLIPEPGCVDLQVQNGLFEINSDGYSANLNYTFNLSSRININASFGRQSTDVESVVIAGPQRLSTAASFDSDQYALSIDRRGERTNWDIGISQAVQPSSNGSPAENIQIQGSLQHRFSEKLNASLAAVAYRQKSVNVARIRENEFLRADATLSWRLQRNLLVSGIYTFRNRDPREVSLQGEATEATASLSRQSNSISVSLRYTFR